MTSKILYIWTTVVLKSYFVSFGKDFQSDVEARLLLSVTWRELFLFKTHFYTSSDLQLQDFVFKVFLVAL